MKALDIREESITLAALTMAKQKDDLIREAIEKVLSPLPEPIDLLVGRLTVLIFPDGVNEYRLDGKPLIEFHPPDFIPGAEGGSWKIQEKYRMLV